MSEIKDNWDKAEIAAKIAATAIIPIVAGAFLWSWNQDRTRAGTASTMVSIAVSVLSERPATDKEEIDPLREWAVDVLANPADPPELSEMAATALRAGANIPRPVSSSGLSLIPGSGQRLSMRIDPRQEVELSKKYGPGTAFIFGHSLYFVNSETLNQGQTACVTDIVEANRRNRSTWMSIVQMEEALASECGQTVRVVELPEQASSIWWLSP